MNWTTDNMPDQSGRIAVVTGANSGIGYEAAKALAQKGAHVVMACRSQERAEDAVRRIEEAVPGASLAIILLDLADLASVEQFAAAYREAHDSLDMLINNAGIMAIPYRETTDGYEMQFGINHLGHFALTGHLLDLLEATDGSRVVTVSSGLHRRGNLDFDDLMLANNYDKWQAYGNSKLANLLFAFELHRRLDAAGSHIISVAAHPGYASTNLQHKGPEMEGSVFNKVMMSVANTLLAQDQAMGALPTLYAATEPSVNGCDYIGPGGFMEARGYPEKVRAEPKAYHQGTARRLWEESVRLTGVDYEMLEPVGAG